MRKAPARNPIPTALAVLLLCILPPVVRQANPAQHNRLSKARVKTLIANAKTPEDHLQLARYFNSEAARLESEAKEHEELAAVYRQSTASQAASMKNPMAGNTAGHCEYFAKSVRAAAKAARELAAAHEQMAREAAPTAPK